MRQAISGLFFSIFVLAVLAVTASAQPAALDAATPAELIEVLKANVLLTGDVAKRMAAQQRLERLGKQDPQGVVPLIVKELSSPRSYEKTATHQRLALIELLRDLGPAAEASVPVLVEILNDPEERNEFVKSQAAAALGEIGTPEARAAAKVHFHEDRKEFAETSTGPEATGTIAIGAFLIRQELRSRQPFEELISASVRDLSALGPHAAPVLPTLLRAYSDRRLSAGLHESIGDAIRGAGVSDVEGAAAQAAAQRGVPDILSEVIADTRHPDPTVSNLAMTELGQMGASEPAIDAMISALREGRAPGGAASVLGNFGKPAARALPDIIRFFDDERSGANAIQAVGKIGVKDPATIAELRRVLGTVNHRHRGIAANALGALEAVEALPELQQALADGGKYTRVLSAKALGRLGPDAAPAVDALSKTLAEPDLDLRRAAVVALGRIGPPAAPASAAISEQLDSGDTRLATAAREALAKIADPRAEAALQEDAGRFADADLAEINRLAVTHGMEGMSQYLFGLPERRAVPLAHRLLTEQQPDSAYIGALFLAYRGDIEPAIPVLADSFARRPDAENALTGLLYSMMHGGAETQIQPLLRGLSRHVEANRDRYTPEERSRLEALLKRGASKSPK